MPRKSPLLKTATGHAVRTAWVALGLIALIVGFIGVFLPLLPTTPLVLLAAFAFAKGSPRLQRMLTNHRIFGPIIADWETKGAIAPRYKLIACVSMVAVFLLSLIAGLPWLILTIQAACLGGAALFVLTRPD